VTVSSTATTALILVLATGVLTLVAVVYLLVRDFIQKHNQEGDTEEQEQR
jgi:hypothetical protein